MFNILNPDDVFYLLQEELKTVLEFNFENILSDRRKSLGNIR
jgi:hypothetical protein